MKYFLIYTVLLVLVAVLLGCETLNPLCTENFCVEGEIYPRDELGKRQKFTKAPINDAQLMAILGGTPPTPPTTLPTTVQPTPETPLPIAIVPFNPNVSMGTLIADVKKGSKRYKGKTINIKAEFKDIHDFTGSLIRLKTYSDVRFVVSFAQHKSLVNEYGAAERKRKRLNLDGISRNDVFVQKYELNLRITEIKRVDGVYSITARPA